MPKKIDFLIAKVKPFEAALHSLDAQAKGNHVSIDLAQNFNKLLEEIKAESPEAAPELPQPITLQGIFARLGQTSTSHVALEIMVGQVLGVLEVLKHA
jgi:hypothetical protein